MVLRYTGALSNDMILADIDAHADWHGRLLRKILFPDAPASVAPQDSIAFPPMTLVDWCRKEAREGRLEAKLVERYFAVHGDMATSAAAFLKEPRSLEAYDLFMRSYEAYIQALHRLHQEVLSVTPSIDPVTGLRSISGMDRDIKREMDRFARDGAPFCLCAIEIDSMRDLQLRYDRKALDQVCADLAGMMTITMRSFDDAFYMGKGDFLLCLKQVDLLSACAVMDRLRGQVEGKDFPTGMEGVTTRVTVSIGVAEPLKGDEVEDIRTRAKEALERAKAEGGNRVEEHKEISPLAQYARDMKSDY